MVPWQIWTKIPISNFQAYFSDRWLRYPLWNWQHFAVTWINVDPGLCCHVESLGHNGLKKSYDIQLWAISWEILQIYKHMFGSCTFKIVATLGANELKQNKIFFRAAPFVVFLWTELAVKDTQFQLLSLTAERKQVEDRVVRCINVLLDEDVNIAHIKQENYKLKWPITPLDDKKQKMGELAEKLHDVMQGKGIENNTQYFNINIIMSEKEKLYWTICQKKSSLYFALCDTNVSTVRQQIFISGKLHIRWNIQYQQ